MIISYQHIEYYGHLTAAEFGTVKLKTFFTPLMKRGHPRMKPIKVVIVDDNPKIRRLLRNIIEFERDIEICGEAETVEQAKSTISRYSPNVVLLDISIDEYEDGLKFLREYESRSSTNFIVLSAYDAASYSSKSLEAGAKAYILKDRTVECLVNTIRSVLA
jgi:DNA-binding NarL/FixJ family response regulator